MTEQHHRATVGTVREASDGDLADQEQVAVPALDDADDLEAVRVPLEASEADAIEQHQSVPPEPDDLV